jgi:hypothetical protein
MTLEWNALRPSDGNLRVRTLGSLLVDRVGNGARLAAPQGDCFRWRWFVVDEPCSLPTLARMQPANSHIVFDNEVYEASQ